MKLVEISIAGIISPALLCFTGVHTPVDGRLCHSRSHGQDASSRALSFLIVSSPLGVLFSPFFSYFSSSIWKYQ